MYSRTSYRTKTVTHDLLDKMLQGRIAAAFRTSGVCVVLVINL